MIKNRDDLNDQERLILEMWEQGASGTEIGVHLNKTRSAVLGKLNRLRIKGYVGYKVSTARIEAQKIKLNVKTPPKKELNAKAGTPKAIIKKPFTFSLAANRQKQKPVFIAPTPSQEGEPVDFMRLQSGMCKYVVSGDKASDFLFCGQKSVKRQYCEQHYKLCYIPADKTKRSAANA